MDATLDSDKVSVFRVSKTLPDKPGRELTPSFTVELASNKEFSLLRELGLRNSSLLLSNCTVWIEGITDRWYIKKYLELYQQSQDDKFTEDLHFSFVEYGGSNVTHWSFLDHEDGIDIERLCGEMMLIADKDSGKDDRHKKLREHLGDERFCLLGCREIENLLSVDVIRSVIEAYEREPSELNDFNKSDYTNELLGTFIDQNVLVDITRSRRHNNETERAYADKSGTIKDKVAFAQKAIEHITLETVSDQAMNLAEKVYKFIKSHNS